MISSDIKSQRYFKPFFLLQKPTLRALRKMESQAIVYES